MNTLFFLEALRDRMRSDSVIGHSNVWIRELQSKRV